MGEKTAIAWTDATWNLAFGCQKVSPGCKRCYAEAIVTKQGDNLWGPNSDRRPMGAGYWDKPRAWNEAAKKEGKPRRIFTSSMCDVFEDHPTIDRERKKLWPLIKQTPWLHWQILTKRPERFVGHLPDDWSPLVYPNVWLGVSVENQEYADKRIPLLLAVPAMIHFISYEPALGPIDIRGYLATWKLQWVIIGGESGTGYREMPHEWARHIRAQCDAEKVAFFFKQSSAPRTEMGIELDGKIVRNYPPFPPVPGTHSTPSVPPQAAMFS